MTNHIVRAFCACVRVCCAAATGLLAFVVLQIPALAFAQSVTYQVNAAGQVTQATYPNGVVVNYAYDQNGNRLSATVTTPAAPSAPGTITDSNFTGNSAVVNWVASTDNVPITEYAYQVTSGGQTIKTGTTPGSQTYVDLTGLTPGVSYTISVDAENADNETGTATTFTFTTPPSAPGTPSVSNITATSATVTWTAASSAAGITGYSYQINGGSWSTWSNTLSAAITGLTQAAIYTIGVRAEDGNGKVSTTSTSSFTTAGPTAPGTPSASSITGTSATISWTAASSPAGVTGYSYQLNGGAWSTSTTGLSVALTSLSYGTTYSVLIRATDNAGYTSTSAAVSFTTLPSAPGTPTASSITGTSATVSWGPATDANGVNGYRYQVNGGSWTAWTNAVSANLTSLTSGTIYTVGVEAEDAAGNIGPVATGTFTTAPSTPGVPSFSNITGTSVTVSWTAATDANGTVAAYSYQLNGGAWSAWSNVTTVNITGLAYGTSYTVGVRAEDSNGNPGSTASATLITAPSAPGAVTASSVGSTTATVTWVSATPAASVSAYRYSINGGTSWTNVGAATSVNLTGLALGTNYTVLVEAGTSAGSWGTSASGTFTTASYYTDTFTVTKGSVVTSTYRYFGYQSGSYGSISPTITTNGYTVFIFNDITNISSNASTTSFAVAGFSSNPGASWLNSVTITGTSKTFTGATATYSFGNGSATWEWPTASLPNGAVSVVHK